MTEARSTSPAPLDGDAHGEAPSKAGVLARACEALSSSGRQEARAIVEADYPFAPAMKSARRYTERQALALFLRDGFVCRYSGARLLNPGALRLLSLELPEAFPSHPNWKMSETHMAFWELSPTIDHVVPVSRGGVDAEENWVTCSMLKNAAKGHFLLEELGWPLLPEGSAEAWDGMSAWLVRFIDSRPSLLAEHQPQSPSSVAYVRRFTEATRAALAAR